MAVPGVSSSLRITLSSTSVRLIKRSLKMPSMPPRAPYTQPTSGCFLLSMITPYREAFITGVGPPPWTTSTFPVMFPP